MEQEKKGFHIQKSSPEGTQGINNRLELQPDELEEALVLGWTTVEKAHRRVLHWPMTNLGAGSGHPTDERRKTTDPNHGDQIN